MTNRARQISVGKIGAGVIAAALVLGGCAPLPAQTDMASGVVSPPAASRIAETEISSSRPTDRPAATASTRTVQPTAPRGSATQATVAAMGSSTLAPPTAVSGLDEATAQDHIGTRAAGGRIGAIYELVRIRTGVHDGGARVRVVLELSGDGIPLYEVVERSTTSTPPGADLSGAAYLDLVLHDVYARVLETQLPLAVLNSPPVTRVAILPFDDDAMLRLGIGLERPARFEIIELGSPSRLVIDILP